MGVFHHVACLWHWRGRVLSGGPQQTCLCLPVWVRLELSEMVNGAQQPGCNEAFPATPGLSCAWVLDTDVLVGVHCHATVSTGWEILLRDECDDVELDTLCI